MRFWKIKTNHLHTPIAVKDDKDKTIVFLSNVEWTNQMHDVVNSLVNFHNVEVRELKASQKPSREYTENIKNQGLSNGKK